METLKEIIEKNRRFLENSGLNSGQQRQLLQRFEAIENQIELLEKTYEEKIRQTKNSLQEAFTEIENRFLIEKPSEYVYILTNKSFPDLIKIGMTTRHPDERLLEINGETGVPEPYELAFYVMCYDSRNIEQLTHNKLSKFRVHQKKEFFKIDLGVATKIICELCDKEHAGIQPYHISNLKDSN